MTKKRKNVRAQFLLVAFISGSLLIGFLLFSEPSESNFGLSLVPLLLLWIFIYSLLNGISLYLLPGVSKFIKNVFSTVVASVTMLAVMFSALGQLGALDIFLLVTLVLMGVFYFTKMWPK